MINIGVVGYGRWGPNLARCVASSRHCRLVAISDRNDTARARANADHPSVFLTGDWRELMRDSVIDALIVATPAASHFEIARAGLQAGKHVLVEKPITTTSQQAAALIEEAQRRKLVLMVDHTFVFTGAVRKIRDLIHDGQLGELYYYDSTRMNLGAFQRDVDVAWDLAAHDIAVLGFLFEQQPTWISACGAAHVDGHPISSAGITLFYNRKLTARLNLSWLSPVKLRRTLIGGSARMLVYDEMAPSEKVKLYDAGVDFDDTTGSVVYRQGPILAPPLVETEALLTEIDHFADCIVTGAEPQSSGKTGLHVVRALECVTLSMRDRGRPIEFSAGVGAIA